MIACIFIDHYLLIISNWGQSLLKKIGRTWYIAPQDNRIIINYDNLFVNPNMSSNWINPSSQEKKMHIASQICYRDGLLLLKKKKTF